MDALAFLSSYIHVTNAYTAVTNVIGPSLGPCGKIINFELLLVLI